MTRLTSRYALVSALLLNEAVSVSAGKPSLSVNVKNGDYSGLEGLEPTVEWSTDGKAGEWFDYEIGGGLSIRPTEDASPLPRSLFGKIGRKFGDWGISARADLGASESDAADVDFRVENDELDLALKVVGSAGTESCSVGRVQVRKGLTLFNSSVNITPRYNLKSGSGDVALSCKAGSTGVDIVASLEEQKFALSQKILDNNFISPSFTTSGDFALKVKRNLADDKSIAATIKPSDSVSVQWTDGDWVADFDAPIDGISLEGISIKVRRKIDVY